VEIAESGDVFGVDLADFMKFNGPLISEMAGDRSIQHDHPPSQILTLFLDELGLSSNGLGFGGAIAFRNSNRFSNSECGSVCNKIAHDRISHLH